MNSNSINCNGFADYDIGHDILSGIEEKGFREPSPIQEQTIPLLLSGKDVIGQAKTGTGKTAAFGIPILERINDFEPRVQALVVVPTRELAQQVSKEIRDIGKQTGVRVLPVYGGQNMSVQLKELKKGVHVVVGTPGRLMDHMRRKTLDVSRVEVVVLDEADRMLDMGFIRDIEFILAHTPEDRQTLLFSATIPEPIQQIARHHMQSPEKVILSSDDLTVEDIDQEYYEVPRDKKLEALCTLLRKEAPEQALIFCGTKRWADTLCGLLRRRKFRAEKIHGDLTQSQRNKVMDGFRKGRYNLLVATDVAARGIDVDGITHVFNYDLPQEPLQYVHRIGRTGRVGRKGKAITIITPHQTRELWGIEHAARTKIPKKEL